MEEALNILRQLQEDAYNEAAAIAELPAAEFDKAQHLFTLGVAAGLSSAVSALKEANNGN